VSLELIDFFCGAGGSSQGAAAVAGVSVRLAANHWDRAIESHAANFPHAEHYQGDIHDVDVARMPAAALFWASPECPEWSQARGKRRDFDTQPDLFGEVLPDPAADRSRALMWDVPRYLAAKAAEGRPVLAGVVENVIEVRAWNRWDEWLSAIRNLGYRTRLIALNSMHAQPLVTLPAPQSRDRLYLAYWLTALGRDPDWDRHLRPQAWCPACGEEVRAVQWWKRSGADMGRYRSQYLYRCPRTACRNAVVEPPALPAAAAIDWADLGTRVGDRARPMRDATRARIAAGLARYARPVVLETTWHDSGPDSRAWPADAPLGTQSAQQTKGLACPPPLLVPAGGTWRGHGPDGARPVTDPMATRTVRESDGLAVPPMVVVLRGGKDARPASRPLTTVATSGAHHGLIVPDAAMIIRQNTPRGDPGQMATPVAEPLRTLTAAGHQSLASWAHLLVPYYGNAQSARPVGEPAGTLTARDRYGLASSADAGEVGEMLPVDVDDVLFRMLKPPEIGRAMAFASSYVVLGTQRERVRLYGNAVTPPVAEVIVRALVEAIAPETAREAA
jgi:DNA (cytosine-5)-methyltransferase 1